MFVSFAFHIQLFFIIAFVTYYLMHAIMLLNTSIEYICDKSIHDLSKEDGCQYFIRIIPKLKYTQV